MEKLLKQAAQRSIHYLNALDKQSVFPKPAALERLKELEIPLPEAGLPPEIILNTLDTIGSPATVVSTGGRYFGFVTGGCLPSALAANWLAGTWDQPADMVVASPIGAKIEEVTKSWLLDVLSLPADAGVGFVTGATMANFCGLAAARHAILERQGWDVEAKGLFSAPEIKVIVGAEVHVSLLKALSLLGLGRERVIQVPVDCQGRMIAGLLPAVDRNTIVCIQAGNVNSGAFDPADKICDLAHQAGAWVHVDGAFGLWAKAAPNRSFLAVGVENADSWALDGHKWLNVPYDSGMVICRSEKNLRAAMSYSASYLVHSEGYEPGLYTPEISRRARGVEVWAALLSLGRSGLADLIERCCVFTSLMAKRLSAAGYSILNEVVLNQLMVSFGADEITQKVINTLQAEGTCWCGGTIWQGKIAMRISISSWATTLEDVEKSLAIILAIAEKTRTGSP